MRRATACARKTSLDRRRLEAQTLVSAGDAATMRSLLRAVRKQVKHEKHEKIFKYDLLKAG